MKPVEPIDWKTTHWLWTPAYPGASYGSLSEHSKHRAEDRMHPLTVVNLIATHGTMRDLCEFNRMVQSRVVSSR